ncbi:MAG: hypothetical protein WD066_02720 [Planctomycetaceae bacterium]
MSIPTIEAAAASERSFRRAKRTVLLAITGVVAGLLLFIVWREMYGEKFTISPETTYITEPLREDGLPDYAAALDALASVGVTPENNAAVLYWQAFGPEEVPAFAREEFFAKLGMEVPPPAGDYLITSAAFEKEQQAAEPAAPADAPADESGQGGPTFSERLDRAMNAPWSADDEPVVVEWIQRNEKPLGLIVEGTRRSRHYQPALIPPEENRPGPLAGEMFPSLHTERDAARLLCAWAMRRLHEGDVPGAQEDLLTCHRLARSIAQGPSTIRWLCGNHIESFALDGDAALAHHAGMSSADAISFRDRLASLPPMPTLSEAIDQGERLACLDYILRFVRYGEHVLPDGTLYSTFERVPTKLVHWDMTLIRVNDLFDRMTAATREPDRARRSTAVNEVRLRLGGMRDDTEKWWRVVADRSGLAADLVAPLMIPAIFPVLDAADRGQTKFQLVQLALTLAAHRADHGNYPATLDELAPRYIEAIPHDLYTGNPLIYRMSDDGGGYLLYSVGPNETDDGRSQEDDPAGDDIAIRTPQSEATP